MGNAGFWFVPPEKPLSRFKTLKQELPFHFGRFLYLMHDIALMPRPPAKPVSLPLRPDSSGEQEL